MPIASIRDHRRLAPLTAIALALAWLALPAQAAEESAAALQKRCDAKEADACVELGYRHEHGEGVAEDASRAVALYQKACDLKSGFGCKLLADAFKDGNGVAADAARAAGLYGKACDLEVGNACVALALMYEKGEGVPKDDSRFDSLYERGCKLGSGMCQDIAYLNHVLLYEGDCEKGEAEACYDIATAYFDGPDHLIVEKDKAAKYFRKACDGNYAQACFMLGLLHVDGDGVDKDSLKANDLFRKAGDLSREGCAGNSQDARWDCRRLGTIYNHGLGIAADPARAKVLFEKACRLGDKEACSIQVANAAAPRPKPQIATAKPPVAPAAAALVPQSKTPVIAASSPVATAATGFSLVRVRLGSDTIASVERDIAARGGAPASGGTGLGKFRISALSGDYRDGGPDIAAVNYDFDAAGSSGRLIAVTIARMTAVNETAAPYARLVAERQAAIAKTVGPLQQKSPTEFTAAAAGVQVTLYINADTGVMHEVYRLAN